MMRKSHGRLRIIHELTARNIRSGSASRSCGARPSLVMIVDSMMVRACVMHVVDVRSSVVCLDIALMELGVILRRDVSKGKEG